MVAGNAIEYLCSCIFCMLWDTSYWPYKESNVAIDILQVSKLRRESQMRCPKSHRVCVSEHFRKGAPAFTAPEAIMQSPYDQVV